MRSLLRRYGAIWLGLLLLSGWFVGVAVDVNAQTNIREYRDVISTSWPNALANHTLQFTVGTDVGPGSQLIFTPGPGFSVISTTTFSERNVALWVNGTKRPAAAVSSATVDGVSINPGNPGDIRYTLRSSVGTEIVADDRLELRIGNHTPDSVEASVATTTTGTTTSTTTIPGDSPGIQNAMATGTHRMGLEIYDGAKVADTQFLIALISPVGIGPIDTRSDIPPLRTNGLPEGVVSGVVSGVEVSLETNKFAQCRYSTTPGVEFDDMNSEFDPEYFWVFHTFTITGVETGDEFAFYVRCIDLEDNINPDDYPIEFEIGEVPTGEPNPDGEVEGDGSGTNDEGNSDSDGNDGTGSGGTSGSSSGGGGSGGSGSGGSGSGGTGSGGGFEDQPAPYRSGDGRVIVNGFAPPRSDVVILVDGSPSEETKADSEGRYSVIIDEIARGVYTFGVYGVDENDVRSSTFSTSFTVSGARTVSLSNINVPPSLAVSPDPVDAGTPVVISGSTVPNATVTIEHEREGSSASAQTYTRTADGNGRWRLELDTSGFTNGPHQVRAKAKSDAMGATSFSQYVRYGVGAKLTPVSNADLNRDGKVNLTDFSILLFWWGSNGGDSDPPADINSDGTVSLVDFSILLFNWTG